MSRKRFAISIPLMLASAILLIASSASAQYNGYQPDFASGAQPQYSPPPPAPVPPPQPEPGYGQPVPMMPEMNYRHRFHGYVGGQILGIGILEQSTSNSGVGYLGAGGGLGLFGGIRLGPWLAAELNWTATAHNEAFDDSYGGTWVYIDSIQINTLTVDAKLHIPTYGAMEPYIQAGIGFAFMGVTGDAYHDSYVFTQGPSFNLGGGLDWWLSPYLTLGGSILYRGMYFGEQKIDATTGHAKYTNFVNGLAFAVTAALHF